MIPDSFKQDLLNRVDIVDVIERYVPLKKTGSNFSACCPFHTEKTPSFTVSPTKQFYHCFGCGANGNAISFVMEYQGLGYVEAVRDLAESVGMQLPEFQAQQKKPDAGADLYDILERASQFYRQQLKTSPQAIEYLKGRGLSGKIAAHFGIGYAPDGWQNLQALFANYQDKSLKEAGLVIDNEEGRRYDRFRDRIMFPILNQRGSVIGFGGRVIGEGEPKYLNSPETPLFEKGRELYGLSQARLAIRESGRAVVVEGYMDVVALAQHGIGYAVATLGTATSAVHIGKLLRQTDEVVFCFDGDAAGRRAAWHALEVSLPLLADQKMLRFLFLPPEHDPDSFVRAYGREVFEAKLREARPLSAYFLAELAGRVDTATVEGRSRLVHEARPLLQKVAAPVMQLQLLRELADITHMQQQEVAQICGIQLARPAAGASGTPLQPGQRQSANAGARFQRTASPLRPHEERAQLMLERKPARKLLQCLLAKPMLAEDLTLEFLNPELPETKALAALSEFLRNRPDATLALIIGQFRDSPHEGAIQAANLAAEETRLGEKELEIEFHSILDGFRVQQIQARMNELQIQASTRELSPEEKEEFRRLPTDLASLKTQSNREPNMVKS